MSRSTPRKRLAAGSLSVMLILPGCATTTDTNAVTIANAQVNVACQAFKPLSWSSKDTDQTIREAKAHNAAWVAICQGPGAP